MKESRELKKPMKKNPQELVEVDPFNRRVFIRMFEIEW